MQTSVRPHLDVVTTQTHRVDGQLIEDHSTSSYESGRKRLDPATIRAAIGKWSSDSNALMKVQFNESDPVSDSFLEALGTAVKKCNKTRDHEPIMFYLRYAEKLSRKDRVCN